MYILSLVNIYLKFFTISVGLFALLMIFKSYLYIMDVIYIEKC